MQYTYEVHLKNLLTQYNIANSTLEQHISKPYRIAVLTKSSNILQKFIDNEYPLPKPTWIMAHGMGSFGSMFGISSTDSPGISDIELIEEICNTKGKITKMLVDFEAADDEIKATSLGLDRAELS